MAPFGAIEFAKWRHVANKWRHLAPKCGECTLSPNIAISGAKWRQIWRHAAPRGASGDRHSPNIGDSWRYRHVAMVQSLKKNMRKIVIAKWRHLAPLSDQEIKSPNGAVWRHMATIGAKWRTNFDRHLVPYGDNWRHMAIFGAIWRNLALNGGQS